MTISNKLNNRGDGEKKKEKKIRWSETSSRFVRNTTQPKYAKCWFQRYLFRQIVRLNRWGSINWRQ